MVYSYEKFYSMFSKEVILLPSDYPYLYAKDDNTKIYLGEKNHWRLVSESLVTFMTSKELIVKHFKELEKMGVEWVDPWEKPPSKRWSKDAVACLLALSTWAMSFPTSTSRNTSPEGNIGASPKPQKPNGPVWSTSCSWLLPSSSRLRSSLRCG